jgi:hypothetical protein
MIGNPKWFSPRKYSGWGLSPNCWQGWAYIALIALPMVIISKLTLSGSLSTILMFTWAIIFSIDFIHIFINMKKDERDAAHEAISERNAMWFVITALALGIAYQASISAVNSAYQVDPVILIALFGGLIVKAASQFYLRNK